MKFRLACTVALPLGFSGHALADDATALKQIVIQGDRSTTSTIGKLPEAYAGGQVAKGGRLGILGNRDFMDAPSAPRVIRRRRSRIRARKRSQA